MIRFPIDCPSDCPHLRWWDMSIDDLTYVREDKEYWAEMDRIKGEIEKLIYRQRMIMAATIIRLAVAMTAEKHSDSKCSDCVGGSCEDCLEGKDNEE